MKKWTSDSGGVFYRYRERMVLSYCGYVIMIHRLNGDAVEVSANTVDWIPTRSTAHANQSREAIAALWPNPTKDQLWQRVARLAGEVSLINGPDLEGFRLGSDYESGADSVRKLIERVDQALGSHRNAKLEALKKAFAAWEAAK